MDCSNAGTPRWALGMLPQGLPLTSLVCHLYLHHTKAIYDCCFELIRTLIGLQNLFREIFVCIRSSLFPRNDEAISHMHACTAAIFGECPRIHSNLTFHESRS